MMNIDRSSRQTAESNTVNADSNPQRSPFIRNETHKIDNSKVVNNSSKCLHTPASPEHPWGPNDGSLCEVTNDVTLSTSDTCIVDISSDNCEETHETTSNSSQSESLSFLDGLLDLASSFSQPQKNVLQTPELHSRSYSKGSNDFVLSPPTPTLQVSPKVVVRFTDIRSGLGRAALSTSFEEKRSPTDVTLRNITKMLCSPRNGAQTPRAVRRVSAGVPPTSSVARKMEFLPQTKQNRRHSPLTDVHRFHPCDGVGSNVDHNALLSGAIFAENVTGRDTFASVPKPTRNLYIPDVLFSSGTCRSDSVDFSTSPADVGVNRRSDNHISEPWQFGILSPSSVVTTFDVGPSINSKTISLSCEPTISQAAHSSHPEVYIASPAKTSSGCGFSTPCFRSGLANLSPPSEFGLPDDFTHSGNTLPHISTFSHLADGHQKPCKSAFTPVVHNYNVYHNMSNSRDDAQPFFTSVTSVTTADTLTCPLSVSMMPAKHETFSPVDMPRSLTSSFLLSPPLPGLDQFCNPNTMFMPSREFQNCREAEDRAELMTPVLDQPINTPAIGEDSMTGPLCSVGRTNCSGSSSVGNMPNLYSIRAGNYCPESTTSHKASANTSDLYTYDLPFGGHRTVNGSSIKDDEALQKLIKASDSLRNDIYFHHAKSGTCSFSSCGKSPPSEYDIANSSTKDAVDPVQEPSKNGDSSAQDKPLVSSDMIKGSQHGTLQKRCVVWNKPGSVREEKRPKQVAETSSATSYVSIAANSCPVLMTVSSSLSLSEPTVVLMSTWANARTDVPSTCTMARGGGTNASQKVEVMSAASSQRDPMSKTMTKGSRDCTANNIDSTLPFEQKNLLTFHARSRGNPNPSTVNATETRMQNAPAPISVASDKYNDYDLIGEPQICKPSSYHYNSHIRNPKKEMIQRQVYENSRRQTINKTTNSSISSPASPNGGSSRASDAYSTAAGNPSKDSVAGQSDRFTSYVQSMYSYGTPSSNPMYPQIMKFVREYEQFVVSNQSTATPLQLAFTSNSAGVTPSGATASISADRRMFASVQNDAGIAVSNVDVATVSSTSDLAETRCYYPIFARLTDEQLGTYLTSKTGPPPKPRNFNVVSLQIGSFRYHAGDEPTRKEAKVKVMFSKRKVIYELELQRSDEDRREARCPFTAIEIPFGSIVGLNGSGTTVLLELNMMAYMFLGFRSCDTEGNFVPRKIASYNRTVHVDLTGRQLEVMPYHQITLRKNGADKFVQCLARFDKRFFLLQHIPILFNPTKRLGLWPAQAYVSPLLGSTQQYAAAFRRRQQTQSGCNCAAGCQFTRCRCVMAQLRCTAKCRCIAHLGNCVNTVNQMETLGLDLGQCKKDVCLMANVFRIKNLATYLQKRVAMQCCGVILPVRSCIPGHVSCPNAPHCRQTYQYSWCTGKLYNDRDGARNHCTSCCTCKEPNSVHCKTCNICYNPLLVSSYCPCNQAVVRTRHQQSAPSLDSHGGSDRSSNNSPDSATSSAISDVASLPTVTSCSTVTDHPGSASDGRVAATVDEGTRKGVDPHTSQRAIHHKIKRDQEFSVNQFNPDKRIERMPKAPSEQTRIQKDSDMVLKCETDMSPQQAVSEASTEIMPSVYDTSVGTRSVDATGTGKTPTTSQGDDEAVAPGTFLQLVVPTADIGQYQAESGVRVRRLDGVDDTSPRLQTSGSGFTLFCGRQWGSDGMCRIDESGDGKRDSCNGSSSSGGSDMSPATDSRSPVSCDSVTTRTPDYETKGGSTPAPNTGTSPITSDVPMITEVKRFCCDAVASITPPMYVPSANKSTIEEQCSSTAGMFCSNNTTKRTLPPHRETAIRKKPKTQMATGMNTSGYSNYRVARTDSNPVHRTPEQGNSSRPSPGEQMDVVDDIVFPPGWPAEGSSPVEAVLGKPLGTSSPIRSSTQ